MSPHPVLYSLYVNDMPSHYRQVELFPYADKIAILATSRQPALLDNFLTSYIRDLRPVDERMEDLHRRLEEHRNAFR